MDRELFVTQEVDADASAEITEFANDVAELLGTAIDTFPHNELVLGIALGVLCDFGRMLHGDEYLNHLARLVLTRKDFENPLLRGVTKQ